MIQKNNKFNVLLLGSGGRESAAVHIFLKSQKIKNLYIAPGNDGMFYGQNYDSRLKKIEIVADNKDEIRKLIKKSLELKIDFVFVGPEKPLSLGIVDFFEKEGLAIVGPTGKAALLEGSKAWAKDTMRSLEIPIPEYAHFDDPRRAEEYIKKLDYHAVVKADGLAAGKGSIVTGNTNEALAAVRAIMIEKKFGGAGNRAVVEKRLFGEEFSFFAFTDGETILPMAWARDYKPVFDNDRGPNTGGMGSYSPYRKNEQALTDKVVRKIALPLIHGCRQKYGFIYKGILYIGGTFLKIKGELLPYVFEINVRMGDPEAQVVYPRLKTDIVDISLGIIRGNLSKIKKLEWKNNYQVCVCAVSGKTKGSKGNYSGYPGRYAIGKKIFGLEKILPETLVFHSGTRWNKNNGCFETSGGRVLTLSSSAETLSEARKKVYSEMKKISFEGIHYRRDIGSVLPA